MKRFIISDLHIGHPYAQYDVMDKMLAYVRENASPGDEVWGLGDWFHMDEISVGECLQHPMTAKLRRLASDIPVKLMVGNHDYQLDKYQPAPESVNPISPITFIKPFASDGFWYCHGHEHDPSALFLPRPVLIFWNFLKRAATPGSIRKNEIDQKYLALVSLVHNRAIMKLQEKMAEEKLVYKGLIMGHTHYPVYQVSPRTLILFNDGDMRHSATFTVEDEESFNHITWDFKENAWMFSKFPRPRQPLEDSGIATTT